MNSDFKVNPPKANVMKSIFSILCLIACTWVSTPSQTIDTLAAAHMTQLVRKCRDYRIVVEFSDPSLRMRFDRYSSGNPIRFDRVDIMLDESLTNVPFDTRKRLFVNPKSPVKVPKNCLLVLMRVDTLEYIGGQYGDQWPGNHETHFVYSDCTMLGELKMSVGDSCYARKLDYNRPGYIPSATHECRERDYLFCLKAEREIIKFLLEAVTPPKDGLFWKMYSFMD
jgi:hypothetical protein